MAADLLSPNYNLNVTEVRDSDFKNAFPGIFNFTVGILSRFHLYTPEFVLGGTKLSKYKGKIDQRRFTQGGRPILLLFC